MAIEIQYHSGISCPRITCDTCGDFIIDPELAMVAYDRENPANLFFCHKGNCDQQRDAPWQELTRFLLDLTHNCGVRQKHIKFEKRWEKYGRL